MISLANNRVSKTPTRWFQIWNLDTDHLCARTELALKTQLRRSSSSAGVSQRTKTDANFSQQNQLLTTYFLRSSYLHNKLIRKQVQKNFDSFINSVWFSRKKWRILSLHKDYTLSLLWLCLRVTGVSSTNVLVVYTPVPLVSCSSTSFID